MRSKSTDTKLVFARLALHAVLQARKVYLPPLTSIAAVSCASYYHAVPSVRASVLASACCQLVKPLPWISCSSRVHTAAQHQALSIPSTECFPDEIRSTRALSPLRPILPVPKLPHIDLNTTSSILTKHDITPCMFSNIFRRFPDVNHAQDNRVRPPCASSVVQHRPP